MTLFTEIKTYLDSHPSDVTVILPFEGQQNIEIEEMIERLPEVAMYFDNINGKDILYIIGDETDKYEAKSYVFCAK